MPKLWKLSALVLILATATPIAFSKQAEPTIPAWEKFPNLAALQTLEVDFFTSPPTQGELPGVELPVTAMKRLSNNKLLHYKSPANNFIRFSCDGYNCLFVKAEILSHSNPQGPAIWEHRESIFQWKKIPYYKAETTVLGNRFVDALLKDLQEARTGPQMINLPESIPASPAVQPATRIEPDEGPK